MSEESPVYTAGMVRVLPRAARTLTPTARIPTWEERTPEVHEATTEARQREVWRRLPAVQRGRDCCICHRPLTSGNMTGFCGRGCMAVARQREGGSPS